MNIEFELCNVRTSHKCYNKDSYFKVSFKSTECPVENGQIIVFIQKTCPTFKPFFRQHI